MRVGNSASGQLQLDVYGEVVLAASQYVHRGGRLDRFEARFLAGLGNTVCRHWREPDEGIWEMRGAKRQNTHSKLMCWVALDRLARLHRSGHVEVEIEAVEREREAVRSAIEAQAFRPELDSYVVAFDDATADASLLLMARNGFHPPDHPRMRGTSAHIDRMLGRRDGLMLRYAPDGDNLDGQEGAFGICGFWAVEYLASRGDRDEALERFEQLLGFANDVGLFAEEVDLATGDALGNFPQAFTHIGLISAALAIDRAGRASQSTGESRA